MKKQPLAPNVNQVLLAVILLAAALLRVWYLAGVLNAPDFTALRQDLSVQDYQARALLSGDWTVPEGRSDPRIASTPYYRPPGYVYLLAAVYYLTGGGYLAPRLLNIVLGLAAIVLMFRLARSLFGLGAAYLCAMLMATYWGFIYYEGEINDPTVFVFLLPCLFLALRRWGLTFAMRWAALAGLLTGCYALMRPNILLFGPVMAAWMLLYGFRARRLVRVAQAWVALAGVTACVIAPVTVRNYVVSGEFVPISSYFGENLLIGNSAESDGYTSWTPYLQHLEGTGQFSVWEYDNIVRGLGREVGNEALTHSEASTIFAGKALDWMRNNKGAALALTLRKAVYFWHPVEMTENKVLHYEKAHYPPLKYLPGFPYVLALFLGGSLALLRDAFKRRLPRFPNELPAGDMLLLVYGFLATYYLSFLPFFVNARARHPMVGFMLLIGAFGLWRMVELIRARRPAGALSLLALFACLYGAASVSWLPYTPDKARWHYARADSWLRSGELERAEEEALRVLEEDYSAYMPFRLGHAFALQGRHELAARLLSAALDPDPESQPAPYRQDLHFHIGVALMAAGQEDEAIASFEEALRLNPEDARAHNDLGWLLEQRGDTAGAVEHYRAALAARPNFTLAHVNLGALLGRQGDVEGAAAVFAQAVEIAPESAEHHFSLAVYLAATGHAEQALSHYRTTLELDGEHVRAMNNLALLMSGLGDEEEAERLLKQALRLRPDFPLARANLAGLYARKGDVESGLLLYREGLRREPGNVELLNGMGYLYAEQQRWEDARTQYEAALEIMPEYERARINLAVLCVQTGALEEALAHFSLLHEQHPEVADYLVEAGAIHARLGDRAGAMNAFRRALEINPEHEAARRNLEIVSAASQE